MLKIKVNSPVFVYNNSHLSLKLLYKHFFCNSQLPALLSAFVPLILKTKETQIRLLSLDQSDQSPPSFLSW